MLDEHHVEGRDRRAGRTAGGVTTTPVWFGESDHALFGWFEVPSIGTARAGVVICPPLAMEGTSSQPALRILSNRLSAAGFAVLRFDYAGTGDSAGEDGEPARVAAWLASVRTAIGFLTEAGCVRIAAVGLRLGATLAAAELSSGGGVDAAVLWDPYPTGRMFVRQQGMLRRIIDRGRIKDDGSVEGPGIVMSPETVSDLSDLELTVDGSVAQRLFVLTRVGRAVPPGMVPALRGPNVEWTEIEGQEALVDVEPVLAVVPEQTVDSIVGWLIGVTDGGVTSVKVPEPRDAVVGRTPTGQVILERPLSLGPNGLFGIETAPAQTDGRPPVLFLNAGVIDHVGPARTWVTLARTLAARGFRTVRFDLSGVGATPLRPGAAERSTRTLDGIQDVVDAQGAVAPDDPSEVVIVGLCSGGYLCSEAALSTGARGVVMINPSFRLAGLKDTLVNAQTGSAPQRQVDEAPRGWVRRVPGRASLWALVRRAPDPVWTIINRLAITHPPAETLRRLSHSGTDVLVVCDDYDAWVLQRGARRALGRSRDPGRVRIEVVEGIDHTLFGQEGRDMAMELVADHVAAAFPPSRAACPS